jgi:hypothetical protein
LLITPLFHIKQSSSVDYIDRFSELVDQLLAYDHSSDHRYYVACFIDGLKDEIKLVVLVQSCNALKFITFLNLLEFKFIIQRK